MLKNAQNEAFVSLVMNNLNAELCGGQINGLLQKPLKMLKIVQFLNKNVLLCGDDQIKMNEFSRLKITEALVAFLVKKTVDSKHSSGQIDTQDGSTFDKILQLFVASLSLAESAEKKQKLLGKYKNSIIFSL